MRIDRRWMAGVILGFGSLALGQGAPTNPDKPTNLDKPTTAAWAPSDLAPATAPSTRPALRDEWIDEATGHRVRRLSKLPGASDSIYFHQNVYTAAGDKMAYLNTPPKEINGGEQQVVAYDFTTGQSTVIAPCPGDLTTTGLNVSAATRKVYFRVKGAVYEADLDGKTPTRVVAKVSDEWASGNGFALSSDGKYLVGCYAEGMILRGDKPKGRWMAEVFDAHLPNHLYSIEIATGKTNVFYSENTWLGHVQFSPTDPTLLMFCHEGPWGKVDRIWTVRLDGSDAHVIHKRTQDGEIAGHEYWDASGKKVWFDNQLPGRELYLASDGIDGTPMDRQRLAPEMSSIHFNPAHHSNQHAGDGNARAGGRWIWLFTPRDDGVMRAEKLCSMATQDYTLEPNVRFSPDDKWIIFRGNIEGVDQVYAVEVAKAEK